MENKSLTDAASSVQKIDSVNTDNKSVFNVTPSTQKINSVIEKESITKKDSQVVKHMVEIPVRLNYNIFEIHNQVESAVRHTIELQVNLALDLPTNSQTDLFS